MRAFSASRTITAIDAHACGEPGRVIVGGAGEVPGATMLDKMMYLRDQADDLRLLMLREPRGYPGLCCNVILPPTRPEADAGFVVMEQLEYPVMSGSNTICVATVLIEKKMVTVTEPVTKLILESPAGLIEVTATVHAGKATSVSFVNVPAFVVHLDATVDVPGLGSVVVDVAWGGMFYVLADAGQFGLRLTPDEGRQMVRIGEMIKLAAQEQLVVRHPDPEITAGITIAQLHGPALTTSGTARNAVIISTGRARWDQPDSLTGVLDRSPCGTGTSARMATLHARGRLDLNQQFRHEGVLDTIFVGELLAETRVGPYSAVVPKITGQAWITGSAQYVVDADDPFPTGYTVGDIW